MSVGRHPRSEDPVDTDVVGPPTPPASIIATQEEAEQIRLSQQQHREQQQQQQDAGDKNENNDEHEGATAANMTKSPSRGARAGKAGKGQQDVVVAHQGGQQSQQEGEEVFDCWQFMSDLDKEEDDDTAWSDYDAAISNAIEKIFQGYKAAKKKTKDKYEGDISDTHMVDVRRKLQMRRDDRERYRPIRRHNIITVVVSKNACDDGAVTKEKAEEGSQ